MADDVAESILVRARQLQEEEISTKTLKVCVRFNNERSTIFCFDLLPDGYVLFKSSRLRFKKINFCMMINEMMKLFFAAHSKPVVQISLSIHNHMEQVFHTRLPQNIKPPIRLMDMHHYDMYMNCDNVVQSTSMLFRYVYRFRRNQKNVSTNT